MSIYEKLKGIDASKIKNEGLKAQIVKAQEGFSEKSLEDEKIKAVVEKAIMLTEKSSPEAMKGYEPPKAAEPEKPKAEPKAKKPTKAKSEPKKKATASSGKKSTAKAKSKPKEEAAPDAEPKSKRGQTTREIWKIAKEEGITYAQATQRHNLRKGETKEINKLKKAGVYDKATGGTNIPKDRQRDAKPAGKRVSVNGKVYYENRANRADWSPKLRLAKGGAIKGGEQIIEISQSDIPQEVYDALYALDRRFVDTDLTLKVESDGAFVLLAKNDLGHEMSLRLEKMESDTNENKIWTWLDSKTSGDQYAKDGSISGKSIDTEELHAKIIKAIEAAEATDRYEFQFETDDELVLYDKLAGEQVTDSNYIKDANLKSAVEDMFEEVEEHKEAMEEAGEPDHEGEVIVMGEEVHAQAGTGFFDFLKGMLPFED